VKTPNSDRNGAVTFVSRGKTLARSLAVRIAQLEAAKRQYGAGWAARTEKLLASFRRVRFVDTASLVRVHDVLLFLRAFPHSPRVARMAEQCLGTIAPEVARLRALGADMEVFDSEEFSGVTGTVISDSFTYEVAQWLARRDPHGVTAKWDVDEQSRRLGAALPRFLPLLEDDSLVEADVPYLRWMGNAAGGNGREWAWLLNRFEDAPMSLAQKTELYDALGINVFWDLGESSATRTWARREVREFFCHDAPLIQRKQISLAEELRSPALPLRKLPRREGEKILDMVRDAVTVRYRELYGTTRGDASHVYQADVGRGIQIFFWGLPPDRRLPLRAYHAGFTLKNGVPINYIEGISLFEWMEVGFNTFYAYRDGETAWIYSKVLHLLHQLTGVTCISVYPYQLGHDNEEAIQSGAFWFYRKLGFRPGRPELLKLAQREEKKLARDPKHRTSAPTLRKLAAGHMFYEFGEGPRGLWDSFSTRTLGIAVQRRMAKEFGGDVGKMRRACTAALAPVLRVNMDRLSPLEQAAFTNFAVALEVVPEFLPSLLSGEKQALARIIRAKTAAEETRYLRLLQQHLLLKKALVRAGSGGGHR
jgi:hypothetical protein